MKRDFLLVKILLAVVFGISLGLFLRSGEHSVLLQATLSVKYILGQVIFFAVPLVIIAFVTPAITQIRSNAGQMTTAAILIAYLSSLGAALLAMLAGYALIPHLDISRDISSLLPLPELIFKLDIAPMFSVISSLVFSICFGLAIVATKSVTLQRIFDETHAVMLTLIKRLIIPILPFFILTTFAQLAYTGLITNQLPAFVQMVLIVLVGHFIWLFVLYALGGLIARKNPLRLLRFYAPAYFTAVGTMSSAATMSVALECASKSDAVHPQIVRFAIPLGSTIHLCGSVLTETFFVMGIAYILTGALPPLTMMIPFIVLLGVFAVGAPGVPGGTVVASIGIIVSVLGFDATAVALVMAIFAVQDSFGTACNITGDGAIALMLDGIYAKKLDA